MFELIGGILITTGVVTIGLGLLMFVGGAIVSGIGYLFYLFN